MRIAILALLLVACSETSVAPAALLAPPEECVDPRSYGAVADDRDHDSTPAFQDAIAAAIAERKPVCIGIGDYYLAKTASENYSLLLSGVVMTGAGELQTRLMMKGGSSGDWRVLTLTGDGNQLSDFAIDGVEREATSEQTHLVQVLGPATHTRIDRLRLELPIQAGNGGGDCIRLLGAEPAGSAPERVDGLTITDVTMPECDRSGIGFQRGVRNVWISGLITSVVGDAAVDMEPTGSNGTIIGVTIRDSRLFTGHGGVNTSITGNGGTSETMADGIVLDNVTFDGQVKMYNAGNVQLRNLRITIADDAAVSAIKYGTGITIDGGRFERTGTPGSVVQFSSHEGSYPTEVTVRNAHVVQSSSGGAPIKFSPVQGADVEGGKIECNGSAPPAQGAIHVESIAATSERVRVRGVSVTGNCKYGVSYPVGGPLVVLGNIFDVTIAGVRINGGLITSPLPVIDANVIWRSGATLIPVSPATQLFVGSNAL